MKTPLVFSRFNGGGPAEVQRFLKKWHSTADLQRMAVTVETEFLEHKAEFLKHKKIGSAKLIASPA